MSEKNKIVIPITENRYLIYRTTEISKAVLLVNRVKPPPGETFSYDETDQKLVATSAVGCIALADALKEMAQKIREFPKEE